MQEQAKGSSSGPMATFMMDNGKIIENMDTGLTLEPTETITKATGRMIKLTEKEPSFGEMVLSILEIGNRTCETDLGNLKKMMRCTRVIGKMTKDTVKALGETNKGFTMAIGSAT